MRITINDDGYVVKKRTRKSTTKKHDEVVKDTWLATRTGIRINYFPERLWGKRIRIRVEVVDPINETNIKNKNHIR